MRRCYLILALGLLMLGCNSDNRLRQDTFEFRNTSNESIWVDGVFPLTDDPACNELKAGETKTTNVEPLILPDELSIVWWVGGEDDSNVQYQSTPVSIAGIPQEQRSSQIILEYQGSGQWVASFTPPAP